MIKFNKPARPMLMLLAGAYAATQFGAMAAEARDTRQRQHHARVQGDYSRESQVQRTANGHTRSETWTNSQGRTASREAVVTNDREAQTRTREVLWQGSEGRQASRQDMTQKTDAGFTRSSTATNAQGQTATRNATVVNDRDAGTRTRTVTATGFSGATRTRAAE